MQPDSPPLFHLVRSCFSTLHPPTHQRIPLFHQPTQPPGSEYFFTNAFLQPEPQGRCRNAGPEVLATGKSPARQTLQGSFSAVSKRKFARKYAFESSRRDLRNALLCTNLKSHFFKNLLDFCQNLRKFSEILLNLLNFANCLAIFDKK